MPGKSVFTWSENVLPGPVFGHQRRLQRVPRQQSPHGQELLPGDKVERCVSFSSRVCCLQCLHGTGCEHPEQNHGRHVRNTNSKEEVWAGFVWENGCDDHGEDDLQQLPVTSVCTTCVPSSARGRVLVRPISTQANVLFLLGPILLRPILLRPSST